MYPALGSIFAPVIRWSSTLESQREFQGWLLPRLLPPERTIDHRERLVFVGRETDGPQFWSQLSLSLFLSEEISKVQTYFLTWSNFVT